MKTGWLNWYTFSLETIHNAYTTYKIYTAATPPKTKPVISYKLNIHRSYSRHHTFPPLLTLAPYLPPPHTYPPPTLAAESFIASSPVSSLLDNNFFLHHPCVCLSWATSLPAAGCMNGVLLTCSCVDYNVVPGSGVTGRDAERTEHNSTLHRFTHVNIVCFYIICITVGCWWTTASGRCISASFVALNAWLRTLYFETQTEQRRGKTYTVTTLAETQHCTPQGKGRMSLVYVMLNCTCCRGQSTVRWTQDICFSKFDRNSCFFSAIIEYLR